MDTPLWRNSSWPALGRRTVKTVTHAASLVGTTHYYDGSGGGQSVIQTDNGDDQMLKQYVWGVQYVDELVQIGQNQDPNSAHAENECEYYYYPLHDANYNVLGVVNAAGRLIERYEYTPYGQRTVYAHGVIAGDIDGDGFVGITDLNQVLGNWNTTVAGPEPYEISGDGFVGIEDLNAVLGNWNQGHAITNDPSVTAPRLASTRTPLNGMPNAGTALCEVGHQGLFHDEEFGSQGGLIHNRGRTLHPRFARFMQRDPAGYADSYNLYEGLTSNPLNLLDPTGETAEARPVTIAFFNSNDPKQGESESSGSNGLPDSTVEDFRRAALNSKEFTFAFDVADTTGAAALLKRLIKDNPTFQIQRVVFFGHGRPGIQKLGQFEIRSSGRIQSAGEDQIKSELGEIGSLIVEDGSIEFTGCNVGATFIGRLFLFNAAEESGRRTVGFTGRTLFENNAFRRAVSGTIFETTGKREEFLPGISLRPDPSAAEDIDSDIKIPIKGTKRTR